jgi:hypothetical protein
MSTIRVNRFENTSGVGFGACVQIANYTTNAYITGTTTIPLDDTIPQNTEGNEVMTLAFTPKSATNKLKITVNLCASNSYAGAYSMITALFQDSNANAIAANIFTVAATQHMANQTLIHYMTAGTTSATTFKVRIGTNVAGTTQLNGTSGARIFGGVNNSSITIEEFQV